ncbi:MAG TPA: hypothetical protein VIY27_09045 [Myxococcota bacterium]
MGLSDDDEGDDRALDEPGAQRPMSFDPYDDVELGAAQVAMGADGMPVMVGQPRPKGLGLFVETFVCTSAPGEVAPNGETREPRARCKHLAQILTDHEGDFRGMDEMERPKRIRRYCRGLAALSELFDLTDRNIYACDLRDPPDPRAGDIVESFEARQRKSALENKTKSKTFEV